MAFNHGAVPSDWVTLTPAARIGMFYDEHLTDGQVVYQMSWGGEPISDPFTATAGPLAGSVTPLGRRTWQGSTGFTLDGSTVTFTGGAQVSAAAYITTDSATIDASVDVMVVTGDAGFVVRDQNVPGNLLNISPGSPPRLVQQFGAGLIWTGTTVCAANTWYTLRVYVTGTTWTVWVDGVQQGDPFTWAGNSTRTDVGLGVTWSPGAKWRNFAVVGDDHSATSFQVRDFTGDQVAAGELDGTETSLSIADAALSGYGGYDVYLTGPDRGSGYYASYGDAHFLRIKDADGFPAPVAASVALSGQDWEVRSRCQMAMGVTRLDLDISGDNVQSLNAQGLADADYLVTNYLAYETSNRPRTIIGHFPNYDGTAGNIARVIATVAWLKDHGVTHWEGRNEPDVSAAGYLAEAEAFHDAVKAGDPNAIVLGPNQVAYTGDNLTRLDAYLAAGGDAYHDELSVHGYTDQSNVYTTMRDLDLFLATVEPYGFTPDRIWQTEGGIYSHHFGTYVPQSWILQILAQELVGIQWERNSPWYDRSHGFWDFPSFWMTETASYAHGLTPRTFIAEIGDRVLEERYDFGTVDNLLYIGGCWVGDDGSRTIAVRAESTTLASPQFAVTGASTMTCVDLFGNEFTVPVTNGRAALPAAQDIVYMRVPTGVTASLVTRRTITDQPTLVASAPAAAVNVANLTNGTLEDDWTSMEASPVGTTKPYNDQSEVFPHVVQLDFAEALIGRVLVLPLTVGWGWGAVKDIEIDVWTGGVWEQVFAESWPVTCSFEAYTKESRCRWHEAWTAPRAFDAWFTPRTATKVRVTVNEVGPGGPFGSADAFMGYWGEWVERPIYRFALKDVRVYEGVPERERFNLTVTCSG